MAGRLKVVEKEGKAGGYEPENMETFMSEMRDRANIAVSGWSEIHAKSSEDVRFFAGEQWPMNIKAERINDDRPCLTINQLPKYVNQVLGDGLQNKIQVKVRAVQGDMNKTYPNVAGNSDYSAASLMEGTVRNIEYLSKAERHYDTALRHITQGGIGWLRIIKRRTIPYGFDQELAIRAVRNPYSVLYDPFAMFDDEPDFTGGSWCFVHSMMKRSAAEKRWPGKNISDVALDVTAPNAGWWFTQDDCRICEYWWREEEECEYVLISNGAIYEFEELARRQAELDAMGLTVVASEKGTKFCVYQALCSGSDVLEPPVKWDGAFIPIVPVLGPELYLDGKMQFWSLIRHSHDAQRMYNYWRSTATETAALAPKAPYLTPAQAIAGREHEWKNANKTPSGALVYVHGDWPAPKREQMTENPAGELAQVLHASEDIKSTIGLFDASVGRQSNEVSGKAILARQREGDTGTFVFHDNLAKAVEHVGRILIDAIPRVYDTKRMLRIAMPEDLEDYVNVNLADLGTYRFDVVSASGPSYTTRRVEAAEMMTEFVKSAPQLAQYVIDLVAKYMDWPGADEIAKRLKRIVPPQLLSPKEQMERQAEAAMVPPPPPTPQEQHEMQVAETTAEAEYIDAVAKQIAAKAKLAQAAAMEPQKIQDMIAGGIAEVLADLTKRGERRAPGGNGSA